MNFRIRYCYARMLLIIYMVLPEAVVSLPCSSRRCPDIPVEPVCGTDMKSYNNICKLNEASCRSAKDIRKAYDGHCTDCGDKTVARNMLVEHYFNNVSPCKKLGAPTDRNVKICLQMNFAKLDKTKRAFLKYRDISHLFYRFKKSRKTRKCTKSVGKYCDINKDKKITENEFIGCFITWKTDLERTTRCKRRSSESHGFNCARDGTYSSAQCVKNDVCYCSAPDGNVIVHFRKQDKHKYNCDKVRKGWEDRKKLAAQCSDSEVEDMIETYIRNIEDEVIAKAPDVVKPKTMPVQEFLAERGFRSMHTVNKLLAWKHKQLDKNSDGLLNEEELSSVKQDLNRISKSCTEPVLNSCNVNKDLYLNRKEWKHCFGFKKEGAYVNKNAKTTPRSNEGKIPTSKIDGCPAVAFCTLSCSAGFARDKNGCLICKCRDFPKFLSSWKDGKKKS